MLPAKQYAADVFIRNRCRSLVECSLRYTLVQYPPRWRQERVTCRQESEIQLLAAAAVAVLRVVPRRVRHRKARQRVASFETDPADVMQHNMNHSQTSCALSAAKDML